MDKAYDFLEVRDLLEEYGYTAHTSDQEEKNLSTKRRYQDIEPGDWLLSVYSFMDEQIQTIADSMGEERGELCRDVTFCMRVDNVLGEWTFRIASK